MGPRLTRSFQEIYPLFMGRRFWRGGEDGLYTTVLFLRSTPECLSGGLRDSDIDGYEILRIYTCFECQCLGPGNVDDIVMRVTPCSKITYHGTVCTAHLD